MYKEIFIKSWKNLQPILFIPDLMLTIYNLVLGILLLKFTGIYDLFLSTIINQTPTSAINTLTVFFQDNLSRIIIAFLTALFSFVFVGAGIYAMRFGLMADVLKNKKNLGIKNIYSHGTNHFWKVVFMKFYIFIISMAILLVIISVTYLFTLITEDIIALGIGILIAVFLIAFFKMAFLFRYPMMFMYHHKPLKSIRLSLKYFLNKPYNVIKVLLIIIIMSLLVIPIDLLLTLSLSPNNYSFILVIIVIFTKVLLDLIINVWSEFFKFNFLKG